jgi:hypothetical protein
VSSQFITHNVEEEIARARAPPPDPVPLLIRKKVVRVKSCVVVDCARGPWLRFALGLQIEADAVLIDRTLNSLYY